MDGRVPSPPPPAPPSPSPRPHRQKALLLSSTRTSKGLSWDCLPKKGGYNLNGPQYHLVPLTFLVHKKFGPREIWDPRSLVHEKYGTQEIWSPHENYQMAFLCGDLLNFLGPKKVRGPNEIEVHFSSSHFDYLYVFWVNFPGQPFNLLVQPPPTENVKTDSSYHYQKNWKYKIQVWDQILATIHIFLRKYRTFDTNLQVKWP